MVRVRFAPSPTGYLHIGNARTALFNWLFARKHKGSFVLRIEDTDVARSRKSYAQQLMSDLRWLNLDWDEGPDIGGRFGPYRQSDRLKTYRRIAEGLVRKGKAYRCYCSEEELEARRKQALAEGHPPRYDNRCRSLTPKKIAGFESRGIKSCLRFKVPDRIIAFNDLIKGKVSFDLGLVGDFVIMKSDMKPAFNFAVTVDDSLMKITHVIRGEDHISNTPRHLLLFDGLGVKAPEFAHMPMTLGPGGNRLSKREGAMSIAEYRRLGYLPEALINYLVLLGWSPKNDKEIFSLNELIDEFDLSGVTKANAIFDEKKLDWFGGQYIRKVDLGRLTNLAIGYLKKEDFVRGPISEEKYGWIKKVTAAVRDHLSCVSEIADYADIFFKEESELEGAGRELIKSKQAQEVLRAATEVLKEVDVLTGSNFSRVIRMLEDRTKVKGKNLYLPIRIAVTGKTHGPELNLILPILGKKKCLERMKKAIL